MQLLENISLQPFNTFGIDVKAKYFSSFTTLDELKELLSHSLLKRQDSRLILGGGSNILFMKDFDGLVLKNEIKGIELLSEDDKFFYIKAAAGEVWDKFVQHCIKNNYEGIENLSLIPGSVGASPMQNIGAYGVEIKDVFESLEAYHINDQCIQTFTLNDCAFGYRESIFKKKQFKK